MTPVTDVATVSLCGCAPTTVKRIGLPASGVTPASVAVTAWLVPTGLVALDGVSVRVGVGVFAGRALTSSTKTVWRRRPFGAAFVSMTDGSVYPT